MGETIIREATTHDLEALFRLYTEFHEFHVRGVPDRLLKADSSRIAEVHAAIQKTIENKDAVIFVAEVDGQLVGLGEVYMREDSLNPLKVQYKYGHLQSMIVTEAYRGIGIGTRMLEAVEQWAKEKSAAEVRLNTWEFREGPLGFYEKRGYNTLRRTLVRKLQNVKDME